MTFEAPPWWKFESCSKPERAPIATNVVPLSSAYPVGLFEDPAVECSHAIRVECEVDLWGVPRSLPAERCVRCRAIEILPIEERA